MIRRSGCLLVRLLLPLLLLPASVAGDDLLPRYEAAQERFDAAFLQALGGDPAVAAWTEERRRKAACALDRLEAQRGRDTAKKYVRELEKASTDAARRRSPAQVAKLIGRVHRRAGLDPDRDLAPITRACGIGL